MKKLVYLGLVLSILLLAAGCAAQEPEPSPLPSESLEPSPTPSVAPTPKPTESIEIYTRDMVLDENGEPILGEYGLANGLAAVACIREFTTEEVMIIARYSDGALATAVDGTLSDRLLADFDNTIAIIAAADPTAFNGGPEHFESTCFSIGYEMWYDLDGGIISEADCAVIFAEHDLTEAERATLDRIIEGFNQAPIDYEIQKSMNS